MLSVDEQMRIITSGAAQIVPEADLRKKLEKGEPLNIKLGVDPTSPDLHLGHAVDPHVVVSLRQAACHYKSVVDDRDAGHAADYLRCVLVGGAADGLARDRAGYRQ